MSARCRPWVVAALLCCPASVHAWGWRVRPAGRTVYYYPAPVVRGPAYPAVPYRPTLSYGPLPSPVGVPAPARPYAAPIAAPPSAVSAPVAAPTCSPEPPLQQAPAATESRSPAPAAFNTYFAAQTSDQPPRGRVAVGFWNLSGSDVTLTINGETRLLRRGKKLQLELGRQFVWRVNDREPQAERVPDKEAGLEIVIRR